MFPLWCSEYQDANQSVTHVCVWPDGRPLTPDYVSKHFPALLRKHNLPKIIFHELRHTCGSMLINAGASPKQVQEYLGHEDVSTTLDIYTHLTKDKKTESSNILGGLLSL